MKELDLSNGLAVMSCEDYENMWRDAYQVHPQGHAALTQQALPIDIKDLLQQLFPTVKPLLPGLTILHLKLVKVMTRAHINLLRRYLGCTCYCAGASSVIRLESLICSRKCSTADLVSGGA